MGMGNLAIVFAVISLVMLGIAPMISFGESNYHDFIAFKSVKKISGDVVDFAVIEVRIFNTATNTINVNPDHIHLKNSANEYFSLDLEDVSGIFSDCLTSETSIPKSISKEFFLCFEVPKDPNEDYILVIDKDEKVLDSPLEFRIYLSSHDIARDYRLFDVSSVYFTVHSVEEKQLDKQKILLVNFTAFHGYVKLDKYGDATTTASLPIAGRSIFLTDSERESYRSLSTDYGGASYHEYCPKIKDILTNQFGDITLCFDITDSKTKDPEYWLVFNDTPNAFACSGACQEKSWELSPFMEDINTSPMVKPPTVTTEKSTQMISPEDEKIPSWVQNTFLWYGQGLISEDEIIAAIQFMIKEGIIKI